MKRMKQMMTVLALAMMLAMPGVASRTQAAEVPLPDQAINAEVPVVVWIDLEAIDAEDIRASAQRIAELLPDDMADARQTITQEVDTGLENMSPALERLAEAGVRGLLFVLPDMPGGNAMMMDAGTEPMALLHTNPGVTPEQVNDAVAAIEENHATPVLPYADNWLRIAEPGSAEIRDGNAPHANTFRELLNAAGDAPIRIALRITDSMKQQIAQQGQADPMMAGLAGSLESLDTAWTTIQFGNRPQIRNQLNFATPEAAAEFNATWEGLLMMGEGVVMGQLAQFPDAPAPDAVQGLFRSLRMQHQGNSLSLTLGDEFIGQAAEFVPAATGIIMMMMFGGLDQMPQNDNQPMW